MSPLRIILHREFILPAHWVTDEDGEKQLKGGFSDLVLDVERLIEDAGGVWNLIQSVELVEEQPLRTA